MGSKIKGYVLRTVVAGRIRETKKMSVGGVGLGGRRGRNEHETSEAKKKRNKRIMRERIRWALNANFGEGDLHLVLHYYSQAALTLEQAEADKRDFLCKLRKHMRKNSLPWKYIAVTETKSMTRIHHHIVLPYIDPAILQSIWSDVLGGRKGSVSFQLLDDRGNHDELASYLLKESESTSERFRAEGKRYKRFTMAQGMVRPVPKYEKIPRGSWRKEPKPSKGWHLIKDKDGRTVRTGEDDFSGNSWQEYFEIWVGEGKAPGSMRKSVLPRLNRKKGKTARRRE